MTMVEERADLRSGQSKAEPCWSFGALDPSMTYGFPDQLHDLIYAVLFFFLITQSTFELSFNYLQQKNPE